MDQGPAGTKGPRAWINQSTAHRVANVVVLPLLLGALAGAFLHVPLGYWIVSTLASVGGFLAGSEHSTAGVGAGAKRGLAAGVVYGIGILIVYYSIRHGVEIRVKPSPSIGTPLVTGLAGGVLTAFGTVVLRRRQSH